MDTLPTDRTFIAFASMTPGMQVVGGVQNVGGANPENALMLQIHGSRIDESRLFVDGMSVMSGNGTGGTELRQLPEQRDGAGSRGQHRRPVSRVRGERRDVERRHQTGVEHGSRVFQRPLHERRATGRQSVGRSHRPWSHERATVSRRSGTSIPPLGDRSSRIALWLFSSVRHWGTYNYIAGLYDDLDPTALFYTPDLSKPAVHPVSHASGDARLTVQATPRNRSTRTITRSTRISAPAWRRIG